MGPPVTDISDSSGSIDAARFRQVLGHFPTGVCVVTTMDAGTPAGLAVGSFASVSLDPPLVLFSAANTSSSLARITSSGRFCVNVLSEDQEDVCRVFASRSDDKFAGLGWTPSGNHAPRIDGSLAWVDCDVHQTVDGGDHVIVIGAVTDLAVQHEGGPLLFYRGGYGRFAV
jgi:3-hydroxy-9,10-secoandrosta-1,3,5(10)-triene-9,17-dione monooxygenase reductase component